jgi:hypothetical protein
MQSRCRMRDHRKNLERSCVFCFTIAMVTVACRPSTLPGEVSPVKTLISSDQVTNPAPINQPVNTTSITFTPSQTIKSSQTPVPSHTPTSTFTSTATSTQTPVQTSSPTSTPTYAVLRGTVLEQANCRYGPGAAYLYKYGLYPGNNLEIIGRNELGTWILIQAIGDNNPCWVKASLLDIQGDVMSVAPATLPLPQSPYYGPVTGIYAERIGDSVVISWDPINLKAGDDSQEFPYLIEAWLCQDGQLTFTPIGSWETIVTVQDKSGCIVPSHARVYGVEKHGYTSWVEVPWPQP